MEELFGGCGGDGGDCAVSLGLFNIACTLWEGGRGGGAFDRISIRRASHLFGKYADSAVG